MKCSVILQIWDKSYLQPINQSTISGVGILIEKMS